MEIKTIVPQSVSDFNKSIDLLNKIFSQFSNSQEYTSEFAFNKTLNHDPLIIEAYENDELVGFALCYERIPGYYHIWDLGVDEKHRGKGMATNIYDAIERYAKERKYKGVTLNTFNKFKQNIRLLLNRGYEIYDIEKSGEFEKDPKINLKLNL